MRISYANENIKHAKYSEIKQFDYFRQILKNSHDIQLKESLMNEIWKITTRSLDHENYVYFSEKAVGGQEVGKKISTDISVLTKKVPMIRISKQIDEILTKMIHLNIPVLSSLKSQYRFMCLKLSRFYQFPFNRLIKKKGESCDGIYFLIEGEIILVENGHIKRKISEGNFFGLKQYAKNKKNWEESIYSNSNETKLWFISKEGLDANINADQKTLKQKFIEYYEENLKIFEKKQVEQFLSENQTKKNSNASCRFNPHNKINLHEKPDKNKNKTMLSLNSFMKRCQQFKNNMHVVNSPGFNEYIQKKKIIVKLEETMKISKNNLQNIRNIRYQKAIFNRQTLKSQEFRSLKAGRASRQTILLHAQECLTKTEKSSQKKDRNGIAKNLLLERLSQTHYGDSFLNDANLMTISQWKSVR